MGNDGTKEPAEEDDDKNEDEVAGAIDGCDIVATNSPFCKSTNATNRRWNSQRRAAKSASLMCSAGRNTCCCCLGVLGSAASECVYVVVGVRVVPVATPMPALAGPEEKPRVGVACRL